LGRKLTSLLSGDVLYRREENNNASDTNNKRTYLACIYGGGRCSTRGDADLDPKTYTQSSTERGFTWDLAALN
jgi:hypothetical protein